MVKSSRRLLLEYRLEVRIQSQSQTKTPNAPSPVTAAIYCIHTVNLNVLSAYTLIIYNYFSLSA
jgi:hypothetical protein